MNLTREINRLWFSGCWDLEKISQLLFCKISIESQQGPVVWKWNIWILYIWSVVLKLINNSKANSWEWCIIQ